LPHATFVNLYGPVETTVDCTYYIVDRELRDNEPIPIGHSCHNTDVFLLDENDRLISDNQAGELCVRGSSLAMGYYNDPERTSQAFVQNPLNTSYTELIYRTGDLVNRNENSELIFKGRKDNQIKHLGYRIELTEIEHVLVNDLKLVRNACAVYHQNRKEIILFYESTEELRIGDFRKSVSQVLPGYMIPGSLRRFSELPRNANGKIDRSGLKKILEDDEN
jgi:acyl-coenzyme A synthetase/AMP-(fatty) acid ligase